MNKYVVVSLTTILVFTISIFSCICLTQSSAVAESTTAINVPMKVKPTIYDYIVTQPMVELVLQELISDEVDVVWSYDEYEYQEEVWPEYEEYEQEDHICDSFVSTVEWSGAVASGYSTWCNGGTTTASGIPLDDYTPTVASRWLPLGSYIEVLYDGIVVVCQVTDRGPYIDGRDLDLSLGTIRALGYDSTDEWGVREVAYRMI